MRFLTALSLVALLVGVHAAPSECCLESDVNAKVMEAITANRVERRLNVGTIRARITQPNSSFISLAVISRTTIITGRTTRVNMRGISSLPLVGATRAATTDGHLLSY